MTSQVSVVFPGGKTVSVDVRPDSTVYDILEDVCLRMRVFPVEDHQLLNQGKVLDLRALFKDLQLEPGTELNVVEVVDAEVKVELESESIPFVQKKFSCTTNLEEIFSSFGVKRDSRPGWSRVCVYGGQEIHEDEFKSTFLRRMGIESGTVKFSVKYIKNESEAWKTAGNSSDWLSKFIHSEVQSQVRGVEDSGVHRAQQATSGKNDYGRRLACRLFLSVNEAAEYLVSCREETKREVLHKKCKVATSKLEEARQQLVELENLQEQEQSSFPCFEFDSSSNVWRWFVKDFQPGQMEPLTVSGGLKFGYSFSEDLSTAIQPVIQWMEFQEGRLHKLKTLLEKFPEKEDIQSGIWSLLEIEQERIEKERSKTKKKKKSKRKIVLASTPKEHAPSFFEESLPSAIEKSSNGDTSKFVVSAERWQSGSGAELDPSLESFSGVDVLFDMAMDADAAVKEHALKFQVDCGSPNARKRLATRAKDQIRRKLHNMEQRIQVQEKKMAHQDKKIADQDKKIADQDKKIADLEMNMRKMTNLFHVADVTTCISFYLQLKLGAQHPEPTCLSVLKKDYKFSDILQLVQGPLKLIETSPNDLREGESIEETRWRVLVDADSKLHSLRDHSAHPYCEDPFDVVEFEEVLKSMSGKYATNPAISGKNAANLAIFLKEIAPEMEEFFRAREMPDDLPKKSSRRVWRYLSSKAKDRNLDLD